MDSENGEQLIYNGEETIEDEERTPREIPILNGEIMKEEGADIKIDSNQLKKEVIN